MTVYLPNIPLASDLISVSQGQIKDNFTTANTIMDVNHYPFNDATANKGKHKFVDLPATTIPTIVAGDGGLYTKSATGTQLFYTSDASTNEYQITTTNDANFSKFGVSIAYGTPTGATQVGGWTFLPGGLTLQYGRYTKTAVGAPSTVQFPINIVSLFSLQVTNVTASNLGVKITSTSAASFVFGSVGSGTVEDVFWIAIGQV